LYCGIKGIKPEPDGWKKTEEINKGLPYGSYVPFARNTLFTGREEDLKQLAENLLDSKATNTVISQAVTGMGGLGKTQLAVEFAFRYGHRFKGVHWLDLRDPQGLDAAIALCGTKMGYTQVDQRELIASTMKTWIEDGPRLLILDNFEDVAHTNQVLVRFHYPSIRLLVTSRRKDFHKSTGLQVQKLGVFSEEESTDFIEKTLPRESLEARKKLADQLGSLPLALELAVNYINITGLGIEEYLKELTDLSKLETEQVKWFQKMEVPNPTEHEQSLFGTFQLSWQEVKDEIEQKIFMISGYCAPNTPIPLEIFSTTLELDDKDISIALYRLNSLALLPVTEKLPSIHPLLAAYARTLSSKELLEKLAGKLAVLAKQANDQVNQTGSLAWFVPLRPHVRAVADYGEADRSTDAAILLNELGVYLRNIADYKSAKTAYERALKIDEAVYGLDHSDVAIDVNNLGVVLLDLGDLAGAKAAYERALKIDEAVYGPDHPKVAIRVNNLGLVLKDLGDLAGAKAAYERALQIDEAVYGLDHSEVAIDVNNLGVVLNAQADLAGAKAAYERALKIGEAVYGPDHPQVAIYANNLGTVLKAQADLAGAKAAYERALKIGEVAYGPDHPQVAIYANNLGSVLQDLGDLAGARAAFERALKINEAVYGPDHPTVAIRVNNLGLVLQDLGDLAGARAALEQALQIDEAVYGPDHPTVARDVNNLGTVLEGQGDLAGARAAYERALKILRKYLPEGHPNIKIVQENLDAVSEQD
jgi:tetratricopeptide (TPR) repeat protein